MQNNTGQTENATNVFYVSGRIHTVLLTGLKPDTIYYYRSPLFILVISKTASCLPKYTFVTPTQIASLPLLNIVQGYTCRASTPARGAASSCWCTNQYTEQGQCCRVGDFATDAPNATSAEFSFRTGKPVGADSFPQTIGLVADVGLTSNSTVTLAHLMANRPELVLFVGGDCPLSHCVCILRAAKPPSRAEVYTYASMLNCEKEGQGLAGCCSWRRVLKKEVVVKSGLQTWVPAREYRSAMVCKRNPWVDKSVSDYMQCLADLIYADDYTADGTSTYDYPAIKGKGYLKVKTAHSASTYQPRYSEAVKEVYSLALPPFSLTARRIRALQLLMWQAVCAAVQMGWLWAGHATDRKHHCGKMLRRFAPNFAHLSRQFPDFGTQPLPE